MSRLLDSAIYYARRGWPVHPLRPMSKLPASKHGCLDATTEETAIRAWWKENPEYNIGLRTGVLWFALDVDTKHADAAEWLDAITLPDTITAVTGTEGRHFLFKMPDFQVQNSTSKIGPHVDIRGAGGYIVAAPSVHPDTRREYTWDCIDEFPSSHPADAPQWLIDRLAPAGTERVGPAPNIIPHGAQHTTLFKYACSMRSKYGMSEEEILPAVLALSKRCEIVPPEKNIVKLVADVCKRYTPGMSPEYAGPATGNPQPETLDAQYEATDIEVPVRLKPQAVAEEIKKRHRFMNHCGILYRYAGTHWQQADLGTIRGMAHDIDKKWTDRKRRNEIAAHIEDSTRADSINWRALEKYEIPLLNGVIDVRSMSMRSHRPEDYLQSCVPHQYDSSSTCPVWQECLDTYFGGDDDQEAKQDAMQEFFGYCLMPHATYKKALLCKGESDCGKSTIPYLLRVLAGQQNCCAVGVEAMDDPRKRAPLRGKLVNLLTELTSDAMIADGGFKTLVSTEEPILFDEKFLPPVLDVPIAKHVIVTNVLPTINDRSRGTFNRLLLISFNHVIPHAQQDRAIWDKLRGEINGILHWSLYGAQRLYLNGGTFTAVGRAEVEEYRASQNPLTEFVESQCELDAEGKVGISDLRDKFSNWYGKRVQPQWFASLVRSSGLEITKNPVYFGNRRDRAVLGVRLQ